MDRMFLTGIRGGICPPGSGWEGADMERTYKVAV